MVTIPKEFDKLVFHNRKMIKHEQQHCPRCNDRFECKVGSISLCQCTAVQLNDEERTYIRERFDDCLCAKCMQAMKTEYGNR